MPPVNKVVSDEEVEQCGRLRHGVTVNIELFLQLIPANEELLAIHERPIDAKYDQLTHHGYDGYHMGQCK